MPNNIVTRFCYLLWCWGMLAGFIVWTALTKGLGWVVCRLRPKR